MRVFLAGFENKVQLALDLNLANVLMSYYYLRKKGSTEYWKDAFAKLKKNGTALFIDSGAHTFKSEKGISVTEGIVKKTSTPESYEEYLVGYIEWLKEFRDLVFCYVELDLQEIVGNEKVNEWRKMFLKEGLKPIMVYHTQKSARTDMAEWKRMCEEYDYVALSGLDTVAQVMPYQNAAAPYGTKIHLFAATKDDIITRTKLYSVDSTSWMAGSRYGQVYWLHPLGKLESCHCKDMFLARFTKEMAEIGADHKDIRAGKGKAIDRWNAYTWNKYSLKVNERLNKLKLSNESNINGSNLSKEGVESSSNPIKEPPKQITSTGGVDIREQRKNPAVEAKRIDAHQRVMKGNVFNWKHGQLSNKQDALPVICDEGCFVADKCPVREFGNLCSVRREARVISLTIDSRNPTTVINYLNELNRIDVERHLLNYEFERLAGGVIDKQVTALGLTIQERYRLLMELQGRVMPGVIKDSQVQIINMDADTAKEVVKEYFKEKGRDGTHQGEKPTEVIKEA